MLNFNSRKRTYIYASLTLLAVIVLGCVSYYQLSLRPVDASVSKQVRVVIDNGDSVSVIADKLKSAHLIRNQQTFRLYSELTGTKSRLQAGGYAISQNLSVGEIIDKMSTGRTDQISITILPGLTLDELMDPTIKGSLASQGFSRQELMTAFDNSYDHPLFLDKPAGTSLEGYLFPETYRVSALSSVEDLLRLSFDESYAQIQQKGVLPALQAQGLNLYQGMTLASIVQKEVSNKVDQRQVAQVFLKRLKEDISLGSDVTFFYAAKKEGRTPSVDDPSPYNTRVVKGLPPGPIANFNFSALEAVMNPAPGDYLYFVAGDGADEGKTFFSRTEAEHNENIKNHCKQLCQ